VLGAGWDHKKCTEPVATRLTFAEAIPAGREKKTTPAPGFAPSFCERGVSE
jgi:hypothetical protein